MMHSNSDIYDDYDENYCVAQFLPCHESTRDFIPVLS